MGEDEGLIIRANQDCEVDGVKRSAGDRWMIKGPKEYVPTVESGIVKRVRAIPLNDTEGIYVRDIKTGKTRSVVGQTYMLNENEELWEKHLPKNVQDLLGNGLGNIFISKQ